MNFQKSSMENNVQNISWTCQLLLHMVLLDVFLYCFFRLKVRFVIFKSVYQLIVILQLYWYFSQTVIFVICRFAMSCIWLVSLFQASVYILSGPNFISTPQEAQSCSVHPFSLKGNPWGIVHFNRGCGIGWREWKAWWFLLQLECALQN